VVRLTIPDEGQQWMTDEIRDLLAAIPGPHKQKKRSTIIKLAFAKANQTPMSHVFGKKDTCSENIWWMKWQYVPEIKAAYEACLSRSLEYADEELIALEAYYRRERRKSTAKYASQAPVALASVMVGVEQRGADRIRAALELVNLSEPETAGKRPSFPVEVTNLDELIEHELARLAGGGEGCAIDEVAEDTVAGEASAVPGLDM